ncbi:c-type cytochrome [Siccirubricoccus sp. G192]|uniref:c-type cytochrome n=1 Tax=Siccirubricoccus sp. G192 TaxID=2849651 RepID=UPI001C2C4713|nr:c-type cytochrome [Siccirubricoccus sp. G192]MBV1799564.1 cytochrome c [Siccirubricoccus sp. G192]
MQCNSLRLAILALLAAPLPTLAQSTAQNLAPSGVQAEQLAYGRVVAETWCANCHLVGPAARGPAGDAAPPFAAIAGMPSTTQMSLRAFLQTPHAQMPDFRLSNAELDGVVAYILSLRRR